MMDDAALDIDALERDFLQQEQVDCPVVHRFGPGVYIREVHMPAGAFIIGHRHKTTHLNVMLTGRLGLLNDDGTETELVAPQTFVAQPGRKAAYIYEDVIWQNIHATDETDVAKLEDLFLDKSPAFLDHIAALARPSGNYSEDNEDFLVAAADSGFDPLTVRETCERTDDQMPFPQGDYKVMVSASPIDGSGLFATGDIADNELIAPGRINGLRTPAARYINHSKHPNAVMVQSDSGDTYVFALRSIRGCRGGELGEEITVDYRQALPIALRSN